MWHNCCNPVSCLLLFLSLFLLRVEGFDTACTPALGQNWFLLNRVQSNPMFQAAGNIYRFVMLTYGQLLGEQPKLPSLGLQVDRAL